MWNLSATKLCITIRIALLKDSNAGTQVSPSRDWVNDSEPEAEFQETVNKSKAMLVTLAEAFARSAGYGLNKR
jgi:anthranilate/para-aminobenzoate synthase component I